MANGQLSNSNLLPGAKKIQQDATAQANAQLNGGLTTGQANDLQARYKTLRSQWVSGADATAQIKSGLQASGDFVTMKTQYESGKPTDTHIQPDFALGTGAKTTGTTGTNPPIGTPTGTTPATGTVSDGVSTVTPGTTPPSGTTAGTPTGTNYDAQREQSYQSYLSAVSPTEQDQAQIDIAKKELQWLSDGETFAQAYERMRKEKGAQNLQDIYSAQAQRATDLKSQIQQQAERQYTGSTGITNLAGLVNANSRDFARELEHATATMANTATSINAINASIAQALEYRQQDLETKRKSLQDRIDALQNKIPQAQLDILKMKLNDSINSISKKEATDAAIAQAKLKDKMENGDITSTDRDLRKKAVLKAINDMVSPYAKYGVTLRVPSEAHAEAILNRMEQGQTFEQAFDEDFAKPFNSSQSVIQAKTQMWGDQNQWKAQMMTTEDSEGNKSQQMVFYRTGKDGQLEFVDKAGNPVNVPGSTGTGTPTPSTGWFADYTSSLARTGNNVWQDTNNPWNIMVESAKWAEYAKSLWAVGFYKSPNGRTYAVFPDMKTGLEAMTADVNTKLNGWSYWVTGTTTLGQLASGWTSGPNAPYNKAAADNYARISGYPANTPIMEIPRNALINAIIKNEWVNPNVSANIQLPEQQKTTVEMQNIGKYLKDDVSGNRNLNKDEAKMMRKQIDEAIRTGDTEYIDNRVKESISNKIKTLPDLAVTLNSIQNMKDALDRYYEKWGDTGLLTGSIENVINKLGETTDPDLLAIRTGLGFLSADYIRSISGTAASDNERKALQQLLPMIANSTEVNKTVLDTFQRKLGSQIKTLIKTQSPQYEKQFSRLYPEANVIETKDGSFSQAYIQSEIDRQIEQGVSPDIIVKWLETNKIDPDLFN